MGDRFGPPPNPPVGSNGASQAILDARALADSLAHAEHPRQALLAYEQKRLPMTADIVRSNRRGGPEGVIDAVEKLAPDGFSDIEKVLSHARCSGARCPEGNPVGDRCGRPRRRRPCPAWARPPAWGVQPAATPAAGASARAMRSELRTVRPSRALRASSFGPRRRRRPRRERAEEAELRHETGQPAGQLALGALPPGGPRGPRKRTGRSCRA